MLSFQPPCLRWSPWAEPQRGLGRNLNTSDREKIATVTSGGHLDYRPAVGGVRRTAATVFIARALYQARDYFLDEPTVGVDKGTQNNFIFFKR